MLLCRNAVCALLATSLASGALAGPPAAPQAPAAAPEADIKPAPAKVRLTEAMLRPPEPANVLEAFTSVRKAIDSWNLEGITGKIDEHCGAVCVTLRFGGRTIGRGVELGGPGALEKAARAAMRDAGRFFGEKGKPQSSGRISIGLEVAGALVPYSPESYDDADLEIAPGIEGVGARAGAGDAEKFRVIFPSMMLTAGQNSDKSVGTGGQSPGDALASCAAFALSDPALAVRGGEANSTQSLMKTRGVVFYRFAVAQVGQTDPAEGPAFLYRCGKVVPERDVTVASLRRWANGVANHLLLRIRTSDGATMVSGLYSPVSGASIPRAETGEEALIGWSLAFAASRGCLEPETSRQCLAAARSIAKDLCAREPAQRRVENSPVASAGLLLLLREIGDPIEGSAEAEKAATSVVRKVLEEPVKSGATSGLCAYAGAGAAGALGDSARRGIPAIFAALQTDKLAAAMPWIVLAAKTDAGEAEIKPAPALREWREMVQKFVMTAQDAGPDGEDLVGGIVFAGTRSPLPSAQSLRVVAGLCAMLDDEHLTGPDERAKEIARLIPCLRFVRQLLADEYNATMYTDPTRAQWGARNSLWDQRMSGEASALALVTLCEAADGAERK
ncbi:MAG: hypothetical protein U0573_08495 [Phycisphaerales bacterium]|nr:hypothetical protein [Planctomycetota bacterium]